MSDDDEVLHEESMAVPTPPRPELLLALRMLPLVGEKFALYVKERYEHRLARFGSFLEEIGIEAGSTAEQVIHAIRDDDRLSDMFFRAASAAVDTALERKRKALARVVAAGLRGDDAEVDPTPLLLSSLIPLEAPHIRLLSILRSPPEEYKGRRTLRPGMPLTYAELMAMYPGEQEILDYLLRHLEASGLIHEISKDHVLMPDPSGLFTLTIYGYDLLGFLDDPSDD